MESKVKGFFVLFLVPLPVTKNLLTCWTMNIGWEDRDYMW